MHLFTPVLENDTMFLNLKETTTKPEVAKQEESPEIEYFDMEKDSDNIDDLNGVVTEGLTYVGVLTAIHTSVAKEESGTPTYASVCALGRSVMDALPKYLNLPASSYVPSLEGMSDYAAHKEIALEGVFSAIGDMFKAIWEFIKGVCRAIGKFFRDLFGSDEKTNKELEKSDAKLDTTAKAVYQGTKVYHNPTNETISNVKLSKAVNDLDEGSYLIKSIKDLEGMATSLVDKMDASQVTSFLTYMDEIVSLEYEYSASFFKACHDVLKSPELEKPPTDVNVTKDEIAINFFNAVGFNIREKTEALLSKKNEINKFGNTLTNAVGDTVTISTGSEQIRINSNFVVFNEKGHNDVITNKFTPISALEDFTNAKSVINTLVNKELNYTKDYIKSNKVTQDTIERLEKEYTRILDLYTSEIAKCEKDSIKESNLKSIQRLIMSGQKTDTQFLNNYLTIANKFLNRELSLFKGFKEGYNEYLERCERYFIIQKPN